MLNLFSISGLLLSSTCLILLILILKFGKTKLHYVWGLFNIVLGIWGMGAFFTGMATDPVDALFWLRFGHIGVILIPPLFFHVISLFCEIRQEKILIFAYLQALVFLLLDTTDLFLSKTQYVFNSFYYTKSEGFVYPIFFIIWNGLVGYGSFELVKYYRRSYGFKKNQTIYFLIGMLVGFMGGITNFLPHFGIQLYPLGNFTIPLYCLIVTYAILRYNLLNISIVFKRTAAYSLAAGLLMGLFVIIVMSMTIMFSTFVHAESLSVNIVAAILIALLFNPLRNYIQMVIDKIFYKKSYDYLTTIRDISSALVSIFDLQKIYKFIGDTINDILGLKDSYLLAASDEGEFGVVYHASIKHRGVKTNEKIEKDENLMRLSNQSGIVRFFQRSEALIVKYDLSASERTLGKKTIARINNELRYFYGEAVVPVYIDQKLILLIILGEKLSGNMLTNEDLDLLKTISNQTAIALKNAKLYQEKVNSEKLATLGMMSGTFAHEIRNPLTSLKTFAQLMPEKYNDIEFRDTFSKIVVGEIEKIDGLISDLLDFSSGRNPININNFNLTELVDGIVDYVKGKLEFEKSKIAIEKNYNGEAIDMMGDARKLKQAFSNVIINGCQAMINEGTLRVDIKRNGKYFDVIVEDTGSGIHPENLAKIFDPFITTKERGIGLGLAISKRVIEAHKGIIQVKSQLEKGTTFTISLPAQSE